MRAPLSSTAHLPRDLHSKQQLELEQICPWDGEELLSKGGVTGVPRIEEMFEGCQALSELSWELREAFIVLEIPLSAASRASAPLSQTGTEN